MRRQRRIESGAPVGWKRHRTLPLCSTGIVTVATDRPWRGRKLIWLSLVLKLVLDFAIIGSGVRNRALPRLGKFVLWPKVPLKNVEGKTTFEDVFLGVGLWLGLPLVRSTILLGAKTGQQPIWRIIFPDTSSRRAYPALGSISAFRPSRDGLLPSCTELALPDRLFATFEYPFLAMTNHFLSVAHSTFFLSGRVITLQFRYHYRLPTEDLQS